MQALRWGEGLPRAGVTYAPRLSQTAPFGQFRIEGDFPSTRLVGREMRALTTRGMLATAVVLLHAPLVMCQGTDASESLVSISRKLYVAAQDANLDEVKALLTAGAKPNGYQDPDGASALIRASNRGSLEVVTLLLAADASVDHRTASGWSSLMVAAAAGHTDVVRLLLDRNASVDLKTYTGYSALMMASARGQTKVMELLLEKGARIDLQDPFGSSALMVASAKGQLEAVSYFRTCK